MNSKKLRLNQIPSKIAENMRNKKKNRSLFRKNTKMVLFSQTILILGVVVVAYPLLFLVFTSLKGNQEFFLNLFGMPRNPQWVNYLNAWNSGSINTYFFNSLLVSALSVVFTVFLSTLGGYALGKMHIPKSNLIVMVLLTFSFIPGIAIYITLTKMMLSANLMGNHFSMILPYTAWHIPFSIFILKQFFETVPSDLIESARIDGCGEFRIFVHVVLPLIKPAVASVVVLTYISCWSELMWAQIVSAGSNSLRTLPIGLLAFKTETGTEWGLYTAGLVMVTIPIMILFGNFQKYFIAGLTRGAVKG